MRNAALCIILVFCVVCCGISTLLAWDARNALDALCKEYVERWLAYEQQKERADNILSDIGKQLKRLNRKTEGGK